VTGCTVQNSSMLSSISVFKAVKAHRVSLFSVAVAGGHRCGPSIPNCEIETCFRNLGSRHDQCCLDSNFMRLDSNFQNQVSDKLSNEDMMSDMTVKS